MILTSYYEFDDKGRQFSSGVINRVDVVPNAEGKTHEQRTIVLMGGRGKDRIDALLKFVVDQLNHCSVDIWDKR